MPRAMRYTCSSRSITHGPAINTSGLPGPNALYSIGTGEQRLLLRLQPPHALLVGGPDERREQRVRMHRLGLELGVELAAQIPRMARDFADLHVRLVRRLPRNPQPGGRQDLFVLAVEFVAVPVPLDNLARAVRPAGETVLRQAARPPSQAHGSAQFVDALQLAQLEDHAVRRPRVELRGIGLLQAAHVARILDHHGLHAQADAEIRHLLLARVANGVDHALDPALAEAPRNQYAVVALQLPLPSVAQHALSLDPVDIHLQLVRQPAVQQRLLQALVGILVFDVLAHQPDRHLVLRVLQAVQHGGPAGEVAGAGVQMQQPQRDFVDALGRERDRDFVHRLDVARRDHSPQVHVAEERDFLLHLLRDEPLRAAQQNIRLNADGAQLLDAVLGGLGLHFLRRGDPWNQRHMYEEAVFAALLMAHLADGFQKRQRLDIAHRAADFANHHIEVLRHLLHGRLDFVGDVRDHLHGLAEVVAAPFAGDDLLVDAAGGQVIALGELGVSEALVVAQVEVRLRAVVGYEHLAVLERAQGSRIHVQVGIELLAGDLQPAAFQQAANGSRRDPLSQRGNHAPRDENILSHGKSPPPIEVSQLKPTKSFTAEAGPQGQRAPRRREKPDLGILRPRLAPRSVRLSGTTLLEHIPFPSSRV